MTPLNSWVVAVPRIFGPKIAAAVEAIANNQTITINSRYCPRYWINLVRVPLKSRGFSPFLIIAIGPPAMGPRPPIGPPPSGGRPPFGVELAVGLLLCAFMPIPPCSAVIRQCHDKLHCPA